MAAPTFTPGDNKQDEKLNPGQRDYDRRFNDIARKEEHGTFDDIAKNYDQTADSSQEDANVEQLRNQESNGTQNPSSGQDGGWANNVSSGGSKVAATGRERVKGWFKKASPAVGVGGIVGIGGLILVGLSSPSLLIVQLKETMLGRFNTQLSSMEARTNKLIYAKMNGATKGFCSTSVSIRCKFSTMSEKQIERMKAAGIEVKGEPSIGSRIKPTSMEFNGKSITARDFYTTAGQDAKFRSALKLAYNPKFAGFGGAAWEAIAARFKISKLAPELNADSDMEEARKKVNQIAKEGTEDSGSRSRVSGDAPDCQEGCSGISEEQANKINSDAAAIEAAAGDGSAASDVRSKLSGINGKSVSSFFKLSAPLDYACQGYGALTTLSYAAKAIRAAQLVRYGMIFLSTADMIKAGQSPEPEDVALLGTILTTTLADGEGNTLVGSATDSFGYKYAAYGDSGASEKSMQNANRFMVGSGFVGTMSAVTNAVLAPLGGREGARATCGFLANPIVQGASIVLGVASLFVPGANVAKIAASAGAGAAVGIAISVLPSMLADIVAGSVTDDIVGEESGNAITSASGHLMSDALAAHNGNGPMTKEDAIAYNATQVEVQNQYIADELRETSPFDATNPHTFLGSIAAALIPLQSSSNPLTTLGSLFSTSLTSLVPVTKAQTSENFAKTLEVCTDLDVQEAGYAADPFCNVMRGIPPKYHDRDPLEVAAALESANQITSDGEVVGDSEYATFIGKCITNETPLGYSSLDEGFNANEAKDCIVDDDNANYYLFYMDRMIDLGFDGYKTTSEISTSASEGVLPEGSAKELAEQIIASGNVRDATNQLKQVAGGTRTDIDAQLLAVLAGLSSSNKFTISSMKRDSALSVGAGNMSLHLSGKAVDISGSSGINGVSFGYNGTNAKIQAFLDDAASLLPENCQLGVPNQAYVNATKRKVKAGCIVFVDIGSGAHIHIGVGSGT